MIGDAPAMVPVTLLDRVEFERALVLQGYEPERAAQLAHGLAATDGALQMLARHRINVQALVEGKRL